MVGQILIDRSERMHGTKKCHSGVIEEPCNDSRTLDDGDSWKCRFRCWLVRGQICHGTHCGWDAFIPSVAHFLEVRPQLAPTLETHMLCVERLFLELRYGCSEVGDLGENVEHFMTPILFVSAILL